MAYEVQQNYSQTQEDAPALRLYDQFRVQQVALLADHGKRIHISYFPPGTKHHKSTNLPERVGALSASFCLRCIAVKHVRFCLRFKAATPFAPQVLGTSCLFSQNFCTILHSKRSRQLVLHSTFFGAANPIPYTQDSLQVYSTYF